MMEPCSRSSRPDGVAFGNERFKKSKQDGGMRGSRRWFIVEAKSYEILVEGVGRRKQFFIIEKSKGGISWIWFGEGSLGSLLKGVDECRRKKVSDKYRLEWREEKRSFSLER